MAHPLRILALATGLLLAATAAPAQVRWESFPDDGQLFPRNQHNRAHAAVAGQVTEAGWDFARVRLLADGALVFEETAPLQYRQGEAAFSFQLPMIAGLIDYQAELYLDGQQGSQRAGLARLLCCGDVFLVNGQSNANAGDAWGENRANELQSRWIRSWGTTSINGNQLPKFARWYVADGENDSPRGAIGAWALTLAAQIVKRAEVPVAILNGSVGATPIHWHMRVDRNPTDLGTIYGRLLWRAEQAGLRKHARVMFWYQGEANGGPSAQNYGAQFDRLIEDWHKDYPALEKVYLMQVRQGCGTDADSALFEAQRQIAERHPEVQLMSTTALPAHDGCHFYTVGYKALGVHLSRLVARDFYGRNEGPEVEPPNVLEVTRASGSSSQLRVELNHAAVGMVVEAGAEYDFRLADGAQVVAIQVQGPDLLLTLDRPTQSGSLRFVGHSKNDGGRVMNRSGVGLLTFDVPIQ